MKIFVQLLFLLPILGHAQFTENQLNHIDSIHQLIATLQDDSIKINELEKLDNMVYLIDPEMDDQINQQIDSICNIHLEKNDRYNYFLELKANANTNLGVINRNNGNFPESIEYYEFALKAFEKLNNPKAANVLNNLGLLNFDLGNYDEALNYLSKSFALKEKNESSGKASTLSNIGMVYEMREDMDSAILYYNKALEIALDNENKFQSGISYANLAGVYLYKKDYNAALTYAKLSKYLCESINDKVGISHALGTMSEVYYALKDFKKSIQYGNEALEYAKELGIALEKRNVSGGLWKSYKAIGAHKKALELYELYIKVRDSLASEENQREIIHIKYKYEYEKQAAADSIMAAETAKLLDAQLAVEKAENKQNRQQKYFSISGLTLALLFGGFIFNRYRISNKQKKIIETQKQSVDAAYIELGRKNKEVLDSISYAKRIQTAILPTDQYIKDHLPNSFVLYKPKDIVAGDFYWMEGQGKRVLFAAADCTGHGVPGAMVSVVCNNGLNRSVREYGLTIPGEILDKTREIVIAEFEKSVDYVQDGMDIALCSLEDNILKYSGAHNPLWIIKNGSYELVEIKAQKQPIGSYPRPQPFITHEVVLNPGDTFYIFSDGFADQFGGEKDRKFMASNIKKLLCSIQDKPMEKQMEHLGEAFESWKGKNEQLDDVCMLGVRM